MAVTPWIDDSHTANAGSVGMVSERELARIEYAERRAIRLFLHNPECRDVISQLTFRHPLHREALGFLWHLWERLRWVGTLETTTVVPAADGLVGAVRELLPQTEPPLAALLATLVAGGGVVGSALAGDPGAELGVVLGVLERSAVLGNHEVTSVNK